MAVSVQKSVSDQQVIDETRRFFQKVFGWMFLGLMVSAVVAYLTGMNPKFYKSITGNPFLFWGLIGGEVVLIFLLMALIKKMSAKVAIVLFFLYSIVSGLTLSIIFLYFSIKAISFAFLITAAMFISMSAYGFVTKSDLTHIGNTLVMGLWGLILAFVANAFFKNPIAAYVISVFGVIIFTGLTAYDVQKIKNMNIIGNEGTEEDLKESIIGALELNLDFVNIFLNVLQLFGKKK